MRFVFLDFSKAFDMVNHKILWRKLYFYGIRGIARDWLNTYLSCRSRYYITQEDNHVWSATRFNLRSLLFLSYINDMASVSDVLFQILFDDDIDFVFNQGIMPMNLSKLQIVGL